MNNVAVDTCGVSNSPNRCGPERSGPMMTWNVLPSGPTNTSGPPIPRMLVLEIRRASPGGSRNVSGTARPNISLPVESRM